MVVRELGISTDGLLQPAMRRRTTDEKRKDNVTAGFRMGQF
jgi:hypothetical protein